jgi:ubiquinone biosynthesis protein Coq4
MAQSPPIMLTPDTAELRTAIEVLKMLEQRLNDQAAHSVMQLPNTELGDQYAEQIKARNIEQTSHIEKVSMQLQNWREELLQQQKQQVAQSV